MKEQLGEAPVAFNLDGSTTPLAPVVTDEQKPEDLTEEQKLAKELEDKAAAEKDQLKADLRKEIEDELKLKEIQKEQGEDGVIKIGAKVKEVTPPVTITDENEITDELLLKALSKKAGKEITSIDAFVNPKVELTPEQKAVQAQERENEKIAFALKNKLISQEQIQSFIADTSSPEKVALDNFTALMKSVDDTLTDTEIKQKFNDEYALDANEDSLEYKLGQKKLNYVANTVIQSKHKNYFALDSKYSEYEQSTSSKESHAKEIATKTPLFKADAEAAFAEAKKLTIKVGDKNPVSYEVEIDDSIMNDFKSKVLTPENIEKQIAAGWDKNQMVAIFQGAALRDNFDSIVTSIVEKDRLKNQAGLRGVPPQKNFSERKFEEVITDKQTIAKKELEERLLGIKNN